MKKFLLTLGQLMKNPHVRSTALPLAGLGSVGLGTLGLAKSYDAAYGPKGEKLDSDPAPKPAPKPTVADPLPYLDPSNVSSLLNSIDKSNTSAEAAVNNLEDQLISRHLNADDFLKPFTNPDSKDLMKLYHESQDGLDEDTKRALYASLLTGGLGAGLGALLSSNRRGLGALAGGAAGGALPLLYKYYKDNYANK